jgi:4-amino-4-deoxy-L-arabinose transferase-like glycosyltransferase
MTVRAQAAAVLLLCVPLFFAGLGACDLDLKGEPREAITAWEMVHRGDWLLPRVNGEALPQKPLLFPWMVAAATLVLGEGIEWVVRLPAALSAAAAALVVLALGRRLLGDRGGLLAAFLFAASLLTVRLGRSARVDMTLTLFVTLSMLCFLRIVGRKGEECPPAGPGWLLLGWLSLALGVLTKGPLGIVLPGLAGTAVLALEGRLRDLRRLRPWPFALVTVAVAGPWYVQGALREGSGFGSFSLLQENWRMFLGESEVHAHGPLYYVPRVLLVALPWGLLLPSALAHRSWREASFAVPLAWFSTVFLVFSVGSAKRIDYLLPLVPAAALLVAGLALRAEAAPEDRALRRMVLLPSAVLAVVSVPAAVALLLPAETLADLAGPRVPRDLVLAFLERARERPAFLVLTAGSLLAAGLLPLIGALRGRPVRGLLAGSVAVAGIALGSAYSLLPADAGVSSLKPFAAEIRRAVPEGATLSHHRAFRFQVAYYAGRRIPSLDEAGFAAFLASPGDRFALAPVSVLAALPADRTGKVTEVARSRRPGQSPAEEFVLLSARPGP